MNNHFPENFFVVSKKYRFPHQHEDYGENYIIATCLLDGPKTVEQIAEQMLACARRFGFYEHLFLRKKSDREFYYSHLQEQLEQMIQARWIQREGPHYFLTETGREEGHKPLRFSQVTSTAQSCRSTGNGEQSLFDGSPGTGRY